MLKRLNIQHTVYSRESGKPNEKRYYVIMVRGSPRVEDWMSKIGFNNPAQFSRYQVWKKFGTSPPKSTLEQRKLILESKLNPFNLSELKTNAPDRI